MGAARLTKVTLARRPAVPGAWPRWLDVTRVERVGLYTHQSLYLLLRGINGYLLEAVALKLDERGQAAALVGGGAAGTTLGCRSSAPELAVATVGQVQRELIEPLDEESVHARPLRRPTAGTA